jgi:hypothetical protein
MIPIEKIENTETCFVQLWLQLELTRQELQKQYKRFCIRNLLKSWFGVQVTDDFIWEVCFKCDQLGLNELPIPDVEPRTHRELLRSIVSICLTEDLEKINLQALDKAYTIAFPRHAT